MDVSRAGEYIYDIWIKPPALTGGFIIILVGFMKNYKKYIPYWIIIIILLILIFVFLTKGKEIPLIIPQDKNYTEEKVESKPEIKLKLTSADKIIQKEEIEQNQIKYSLLVKDNKYASTISENSTVFQAMESLIKENKNFTFKYTENSGMGNFITEINGDKGTPGKYWIYYINENKPPVGVSKYILEDGDIIRWSQEGI